ncbi:hypothetical protein K402DRAFT_376980 [Aulographum hederae CBS 113979]|uniref:DUF4336 domain-containing protein n=1 Tax=Aulographum hederae CBS 113979 TaxID=1176131 RepID=A0A6G1H0G1_9PEZI|nr:hypothetical protein K402DRAFT_376980 [Aulographum hederae CBS 113979]
MTSKLIPNNPAEVMVIRKVTPNVTTFSTPFWRFGHVKVGGRGTAVRMRNGAVAIFSPTALTPEVKQTVKDLGEVKYIAALDIEHHIFLGPWHEQYPNAKVLGPEGLPEKREKQKNEKVPFAVVFTAKDKETTKVDADFDSDFDYEFVDGHMNKELVFNYKPDGTLIEADLMFNLPATEQFSKVPNTDASSGFLTKRFIGLNNTQGAAMGQRRFIWHTIATNRPSYNKSMSKINGWNFDRIIPCHGDVIETGGKGIFQKIMEWHLEKKA